MKLTDLQNLKQAVATALKDSPQAAAGLNPVLDAIMAESERQEAAQAAAEKQASEIALAKTQLEVVHAQMIKDLDAVRAELNTIKAAAAATAADAAFNDRMAAIDEVFDLEQDERAEFVADVKEMNDEAFAKFMEKSKKLMKEKTKKFKKEKDDESKAAQASLVAKLKDKNVKASFNGLDLVVEEVIASAAANETSPAAGSVQQPLNTGDLKELAKTALAGMRLASAVKKNEPAK